MTDAQFLRLLILPVIPILFAYLEQGGNLYAEQTLNRPTILNLLATLFFSVIYSVVAAAISTAIQVNLALMMVNYGFGFSIVSMLLELKWQRLPSFTLNRIRQNTRLKVVLFMAVLGFVVSAYFVIV